ncbi:hypothetical protein F5I97DRAFT_175908 [Phlebopus sp. FC_14]|nr:hypothetical protein F5I97DRAFT_175908 [Phlebopus sp. FC_14]
MRTRLDLSRLPKASGIKSLNTRNTTPGYTIPGHINRQHVLDRNHPAVRLSFHAFPQFTCPDFNIRALPKATLHRKDYTPPNPIPPSRKRAKKDISLIFHTFKKNTSKLAVVRSRLRSKMSAAISLVVTRDADGVEASQLSGASRCGTAERPPDHAHKPAFTLISNPIPKDYVLVLRDWTYVISPNLSVYRTSLPELVCNVRKALFTIKDKATRLELSWRKPPPHRSRLKQDIPVWPKSISGPASEGPTSRSGHQRLDMTPSVVSTRRPDRPRLDEIAGGRKSFQPRKLQTQPSTAIPRHIPRLFSSSPPTSAVLELTQKANKYSKEPLGRPGDSTPDPSPVPSPNFQDRMFTNCDPFTQSKQMTGGKGQRRDK